MNLLARRAQLVYGVPLSIVAPAFAPKQRLVILSQMRTGSELLVTLLDSHPQICCEKEILQSRHPRLRPARWLECRAAFAARHRGPRVYGCKVLTTDLFFMRGHDPVAFVRELRERGYLFITIERRDTLLQAVSLVEAQREKKWHWHEHERDRAAFTAQPIDPKELLDKLEFIERVGARAEALLGDQPVIPFVYEDDLEDPATHQRTADRVYERLGLDSAPVSSDLIRIAPPSVEARVTNHDEMVTALRASPFAHLVSSS